MRHVANAELSGIWIYSAWSKHAKTLQVWQLACEEQILLQFSNLQCKIKKYNKNKRKLKFLPSCTHSRFFLFIVWLCHTFHLWNWKNSTNFTQVASQCFIGQTSLFFPKFSLPLQILRLCNFPCWVEYNMLKSYQDASWQPSLLSVQMDK